MTLFETFKIINQVAVTEPNIHTIVNTGNVFDLNNDNAQVKYSAFCVQQQEHQQIGDYVTYRFNLFYVDRLTDDKRNKLEVQSTAISTLQNIIRGLIDIELIDVGEEVTYQTFTERFSAECAGAYCSLSVTSATPICYEEYLYNIEDLFGEFSYDYSDDFFVRVR